MTIVLPSTSDGRVHRSEALQEDAQIPTLVAAQNLAATTDIPVGNTVPAGTGKFGSFPDDMVVTNPDILLMTYQKAAVWAGTPAHDFPERWYAHSGAVGAVGNRVNSPQGNTFWVMQPDSYTSNYTDTGNLAGGGASAVYANWRNFNAAKIANEIVSFNTHFTGDPLQGAWLDTMGPAINVGQVVPGTSTKYTNAAWETAVNPVGPIVKAALPAGMYCFGNGGASPNLYQFVDGLMWENWLRSATSAALPTGCPTDSKFTGDVDTMMTAQAFGTVGQPYTKLWSSMTLAQQKSWQRFTVAAYMIGNLGKLFLCFNMHGASDGSTPGADLNPWDPNYILDPAFSINFGAPLSTGTKTTDYRLQQRPVSLGWLYGRKFQNGIALVNLDANSQTWTLSRAYTELDGTPAATNYVVPGKSGVLLKTTAAPTITSGILAVAGAGAVTIPASVRVRLAGPLDVTGAGAVTVLAVNPDVLSGPLSVSGSGAIGISGSLQVNLSGTVSVSGTAAVTIPASVRVRLAGPLAVTGSAAITAALTKLTAVSGTLAVSGTGVVAVSDSQRIRKSGTIAVAGTNATTISDSLRIVVADTLVVGASGFVQVVASTVVGGVSEIASGRIDVTGLASADISASSLTRLAGPLSVVGAASVSVDSARLVLSGLLSLSGAGLVSVLGVGGPVVTSGLLDVSGTSLIVHATSGLRIQDSLDPQGDYIRRFFH